MRLFCAMCDAPAPHGNGIAQCASNLRTQRDEATALLRTLEFGSRHLSADGELVPCCPDCDAETGQAHSEACRVDGVLRRST